MQRRAANCAVKLLLLDDATEDPRRPAKSANGSAQESRSAFAARRLPKSVCLADPVFVVY